MRLLFKQNIISAFFGYKIYNENKELVYNVKRKFSFGHSLKIHDSNNNEIGAVKGETFTFTPEFEMFENGYYVGSVTKDISFFKPKFLVNFRGWHIKGDVFEWEYEIRTSDDKPIAYLSKAMGLTDTYAITVCNPEDALYVLMIALIIDLEKSSRVTI